MIKSIMDRYDLYELLMCCLQWSSRKGRHSRSTQCYHQWSTGRRETACRYHFFLLPFFAIRRQPSILYTHYCCQILCVVTNQTPFRTRVNLAFHHSFQGYRLSSTARPSKASLLGLPDPLSYTAPQVDLLAYLDSRGWLVLLNPQSACPSYTSSVSTATQ